MTGAHASAIVAIEILVEQDQITPVRIVLEQGHIAIERTTAIAAAAEQIDEAVLKLERGIPEGDPATGAGGKFDLEGIALVMTEFLQCFDQQEVDRHPDRTPPV